MQVVKRKKKIARAELHLIRPVLASPGPNHASRGSIHDPGRSAASRPAPPQCHITAELPPRIRLPVAAVLLDLYGPSRHSSTSPARPCFSPRAGRGPSWRSTSAQRRLTRTGHKAARLRDPGASLLRPASSTPGGPTSASPRPAQYRSRDPASAARHLGTLFLSATYPGPSPHSGQAEARLRDSGRPRLGYASCSSPPVRVGRIPQHRPTPAPWHPGTPPGRATVAEVHSSASTAVPLCPGRVARPRSQSTARHRQRGRDPRSQRFLGSPAVSLPPLYALRY